MRRSLRLPVLAAAGTSFLLNGAFILVEWHALTPAGHDGSLFYLLPLALVFILMIVTAVALLALLAAMIRRLRPFALPLALACAVYAVTGIACFRVAGELRNYAFERLAVRSKPLVMSIRRYTAATGTPPATLRQLVPAYLDRIPTTGMGAYPEFRYIAGAAARENYHGNEWVLVVETPSGFINFDIFIYYPRQNYPAVGHGGVLERIRDWAYVHE